MDEKDPSLDPADRELLGKVADQIARRGLTVPAVFFLESSKPLSFVGSQALLFLEPFIRAFLNAPSYDRFVRLLEDRGNYEILIETIETKDAELESKRREAKRRERESRRAGGGASGWRRWFRRGRSE